MFSDLLKHIGDLVGEFFSKDEVFWLLFFVIITGGVTVISIPSISIEKIILDIFDFFLRTWWFWAFLILLPLTQSFWLYWKQEKFKNDIKWVLLELRIPREIDKSPKAMEQVFAAFHTLRNSPGNVREKYFDGEVTRSLALEFVSLGGEIHFYIRTYAKQRNVVEAAMFAYYSDVEIVEVDDYVDRLPRDLQEVYEQDQSVWGTEMILSKEQAYPIKTYPSFEDEEESRQLDPISTFLEVLGKIKKEEIVAIQFLTAPADKSWAEEGMELLEELIKPKTINVPSESEEGGDKKITITRTPGQTDVIEKIEANLSKPAFYTLIRLLYLSPKSLFSDSLTKGLTGAFNQYSSLDLNSFRQNYGMSTRVDPWTFPHIFSKTRAEYRKQRIIYNYKRREVPPETWAGNFITSHFFNSNHSKRFILNIEGLASLFHPPTKMVLTAPHIQKMESRKAGPPAGLPIFGEDEEIKKYVE